MPKVDLLQSNAFEVLTKQNSAQEKNAGPVKFSETLKDMINQVNEKQKNSVTLTENFLAGKEGNLHNVMAAMEEARISFQLMMEIRNKLQESYNELMRMPV